MTDLEKTTDPPMSRRTWLERGLLVAIVLGCAAAMSPSQADPDLWGHVLYGRDALAGGIPATTTYSFTAEGYPWINHENLSEVILALTANLAGGPGLLVLKTLVGMVMIGLMLCAAAKRGVPIVPACIVVLLVAINLAYRWAVRPQIFTCLLFTLTIVLLGWCFHGWQDRWHLPWLRKLARARDDQTIDYSSRRMRWLWLGPVIFAVWANTHGGFVAGYCIFAAILGLRAVEILAVRGRAGWGIVRRLTMMIVASGLATFLNPYGPNLHRWLLGSLGGVRPEITEWSSLSVTSYPFYPFLLVGVVTVVSLAASRRSLDFTHVVVLALTAWQSVAHERHIAFFAILFGFWMAQHVASALVRLRVSSDEGDLDVEHSPTMRWVFAGGLCLVFVVLGARLYQRLHDLPVKKDRFPIAACEYVAEQNLTGRLVVTYNWAQYAIAALGPRTAGGDGLLVAFDGRFRTCYPQEIVDMHFDFILGSGPNVARKRSPNSPPPQPGRVLEFGRPDLVLLSRRQPHSVSVMRRHRDKWVLLYQDGLAQLWGRASKYDNPRSCQYIQPAQRRIGEAPQIGTVSWPAMPVRGGGAERIAGT